MLKHVVMHKMENEEVTAPVAVEKLLAMKQDIPEILDIQAGCDFLHSSRSFSFVLTVTLPDRAALSVYADHPAHKKVKEYIHTYSERSVTVDYEV